jgi:hypothetical protein
MPSVIVPVGFTMGPRYRAVWPPDPVPECYEVHLADRIEELTYDEVAVWGTAFLNPDLHSRLEVDRRSLVDLVAAAPRGGRRADQMVDHLLDRGLLLEYDTDGPLEPMLARHRLLPLGEGLGSTPDEPRLHRVGHGGQAVVALPIDVFTQWAFAFLHPNLCAACVYLAGHGECAARVQAELTPDALARDLARHLPVLITSGCAFIDPAVSL